MKHSLLLASAFALLLGSAPATVLASGSDASGGARTGVAVAYQQGKRVYATHYACGSCPLSEQRLTKDLARQILSGNPRVDLDENEAKALNVFLKRRFKL